MCEHDFHKAVSKAALKSLVEWREEHPEDDMKRLPLGQFHEGLSGSLTFDFSLP